MAPTPKDENLKACEDCGLICEEYYFEEFQSSKYEQRPLVSTCAVCRKVHSLQDELAGLKAAIERGETPSDQGAQELARIFGAVEAEIERWAGGIEDVRNWEEDTLDPDVGMFPPVRNYVSVLTSLSSLRCYPVR